jgi:hypothetical protein
VAAVLSFSAALAPAKLRAPVARRSVRARAATSAEYKKETSQFFDLKARRCGVAVAAEQNPLQSIAGWRSRGSPAASAAHRHVAYTATRRVAA